MQTVSSRHNPVYKTLAALKKDRGLMLLEGRRLVADAIARGITPRMIAVTESFIDAHRLTLPPDIVLADTLFLRISETDTPQGILAFLRIPWALMTEIEDMEKVIFLTVSRTR
jgi:tRNA G18 (ribose-2'-O)-methylase SpoU